MVICLASGVASSWLVLARVDSWLI